MKLRHARRNRIANGAIALFSEIRADFARSYNGPGHKQNRCDEKIAQAYARHNGGFLAPSTAEIQMAPQPRQMAHGESLQRYRCSASPLAQKR